MSNINDNTLTESPIAAGEIEPLDINDCICFGIRKASRAITQICDDSLKRSKLRSTQFTILLALSQKGSITIGKLAEELWIDPTALSRNLKPLVRENYLEIQPGSDQRTRFISLSEKGKIKTDEALNHWKETQEKLRTLFTESDLAQIKGSLNMLLESIKDHR
ncbi:MAG: MarR family winged helix-turn-helix transcriptional regulator [Verrucomicrobiota bacterium]